MTDDNSNDDWNFKVEDIANKKSDIAGSIKKRISKRNKREPVIELERSRPRENNADESNKRTSHRVYTSSDMESNGKGFDQFQKIELKKRLFAYCIDLIIITACAFVFHLIFAFALPESIVSFTKKFPYIEILFDAFIIYLVLIRQLQVHSSTIGKRYFHLEVVTPQGPYLSLGECFMREIVGKLVLSALLPLSCILIIFQKQGRSIHDYIAGTMVVDTE